LPLLPIPLRDRYGRSIHYLRVSVTDRCNMRCAYCMPPEGVPALTHDSVLRLEQITRLVDAAAGLGFDRVRLTGGEPLVRRGVLELVHQIAVLPGISELAMTTNATLLEGQAEALVDAGLTRVNISLDSLRPERFHAITRLGRFADAWRGILAAERVGLSPLKLNVVVARGFNDDELVDFARLTLEHAWHIRFIEVMPLEGVGAWGGDLTSSQSSFVSVSEMRERLVDAGVLTLTEGPSGNGPARYYRIPGGIGTVGFISPLSEHFCGDCNRLRLTVDGWLRSCLFSDDGVYVKDALDREASIEELQHLVAEAIHRKPESRPAELSSSIAGQAMSRIGG
jgi:GTP 3',8-cyclase